MRPTRRERHALHLGTSASPARRSYKRRQRALYLSSLLGNALSFVALLGLCALLAVAFNGVQP